MESKIKIDAVNIPVPFRGPGNIIKQKEIRFDIYKVDGHYEAVPVCSEQDRVLASIPSQLSFDYKDGKPHSLWGPRDGNLHVIKDLVEELHKRNLL